MPYIIKHRGAAIVALLLAMAAATALAATTAPSSFGTTNIDDGATASAERAAYGRPAPRPVREWAAAWNTGSPERMAALFTEDGAYEDPAFQVEFRGRDGVAQWVEITNAAIADTRVEVEEASRAGDRIYVEWTFSGTNSAGGLAGQGGPNALRRNLSGEVRAAMGKRIGSPCRAGHSMVRNDIGVEIGGGSFPKLG